MNNPPDAHENSHVSQPVSGGASFNPALAGMGGSIAGTVVGGAMSLLGNYIQQKYYERNLKSQFDYNEKAADNADKRQRALYYDLYSPEAQKQMYINAGFSPSILYSGGATSSQGATPHGAQGAGANMSMPTMAPLSLNTDLALTAAQIELMRSQARKNNVDADTQEGKTPLGEANIQSLLSGAGLNESVTALNRIEKEIKEETKEFNVQLVEENLNLIRNQAMHEYWKACDAGLQFDFNLSNFDTNCELLTEQLLNLQADTLLKEAQKHNVDASTDKLRAEINLVNQQVKESIARIQQGWRELALNARGQFLDWQLGFSMQQNMKNLQDKELKYLREALEQNKDLTEKGYWFGVADSFFKAASNIVSAFVIKGGLSGNAGRTIIKGFSQ